MTSLIILISVLGLLTVFFILGCAKLEKKEERWRQLHPPDRGGGGAE